MGSGGPQRMTRAIVAWLVHLYTALGLVAAVLMGVLIVRGGDDSFRLAFALMIVATTIDSTDGIMARKVNVKHVLPGFDGAMLDNLTDFHTYTTLPVFLLWRADVLPGALQWFLMLPILASAYGYSQTNAKTPDGYFQGFPSLWNVVAFYLYMLRSRPVPAAAIIVVLSALTFVPSRYFYPSRGGRFARAFTIGAVAWTLLTLLVLLRPAGERETLALISTMYPLAYMAFSWGSSMRRADGRLVTAVDRDPL
jgi:phosphatidylcholine synthase